MRNDSRPRPGCGCLILAVLLLLLTLGAGSELFLSHNYSAPGIRVAQVCVLPTGNVIPTMAVYLTLYDTNGHPIEEHTYQVKGQHVQLQGDIIEYGLGSGYKLTSLQGYDDDLNLARNVAPTHISLNGGEDGFYRVVRNIPTVSPNSGPLALNMDGKTYNIFVTQNGLTPTWDHGSPGCRINQQPA